MAWIRDVTLGLPANHCCTLHGPSGVFANCPDGKVAFREKAASREAASFKQVILKTKAYDNWNHIIAGADTDADWRTADVATQQKLGLLPGWRTGHAGASPPGAGLVGRDLRAGQGSARRGGAPGALRGARRAGRWG